MLYVSIDFLQYSDPDDKINYMNRLIRFLLPVGILNVCTGLNNIMLGLNSFNDIRVFNCACGALCLIIGLLAAENCAAINIRKKKIKLQQKFFEN